MQQGAPGGEVTRRGATGVLIRGAQEGSHRAAALLASRCDSRILRMVRRRLGAGLRGVLESRDVAQEVWVETLTSLDRYHPRSERSFDAWLRSLVENRIRNLTRNQWRRPMTWVGPQVLDSNEARDKDRAQEGLDLERTIQKLPKAQREAWGLRYTEGLSYREIGRRTGRSEAAVSMLLTRARSTLTRSFSGRRR